MAEKDGFNKREFLRIRLAVPIEFIHISRDGSVPEGTWASSEMVEIGGGGARILSHGSIEEGDVLCLRFAIPDTLEQIKAYARVVGICGDSEEICIKFVELSERDRGKILRYAFREQIRRHKDRVKSDIDISPEGDESDEDGIDN